MILKCPLSRWLELFLFLSLFFFFLEWTKCQEIKSNFSFTFPLISHWPQSPGMFISKSLPLESLSILITLPAHQSSPFLIYAIATGHPASIVRPTNKLIQTLLSWQSDFLIISMVLGWGPWLSEALKALCHLDPSVLPGAFPAAVVLSTAMLWPGGLPVSYLFTALLSFCVFVFVPLSTWNVFLHLEIWDLPFKTQLNCISLWWGLFFFFLTFYFVFWYSQLGLPQWLSSKESACNAGDAGDSGNPPCRRKWQSTLVFLAGKFHGQRSLVGCGPRGHKSWTWLKRLSMHSQLTRLQQF